MQCNKCNAIYGEKSIKRWLEGGGEAHFEGDQSTRYSCCPIKNCDKKWTNFEIYVNSN